MAIHHLGRQQRHERDHHRQPIPEQPLVVRRQVIVGGADGGQHHTDEEDRVRHPFAGGGEDGARARNDDQPARPTSRKPTFEATSKKFAPRHRAVVGEVVVVERLRNPRRSTAAATQNPWPPGCSGSASSHRLRAALAPAGSATPRAAAGGVPAWSGRHVDAEHVLAPQLPLRSPGGRGRSRRRCCRQTAPGLAGGLRLDARHCELVVVPMGTKSTSAVLTSSVLNCSAAAFLVAS